MTLAPTGTRLDVVGVEQVWAPQIYSSARKQQLRPTRCSWCPSGRPGEAVILLHLPAPLDDGDVLSVMLTSGGSAASLAEAEVKGLGAFHSNRLRVLAAAPGVVGLVPETTGMLSG